jgi:uncharacterized Zn-binding protein involved in type VI secretion
MKRYHITPGAATTAGGTVTAASGGHTINGACVAVENDPVACPACKSIGRISCVEPRVPERSNGKAVALQDDLCLCGCSPPPRLLANQALKYQFIHAVGEQSATPSANTDDDMPLRLLDHWNRQPLAGQAYRLALPGKVISGTTDDDGYTQPLSAADRAALLDAWHAHAAATEEAP